MKYILLVGIEYKKYKRPANIRISADERLIDDFDLDKDIKSSGDSDQGYFRVYDIDDTHLKNFLKLTVSNSNSDYTNGFMKNSSLIKFPIIALFPKELTKNNCERLNEIMEKINRPGHPEHILKTQDLKNVPLSAISESRVSWPCPDFYKVTYNKHNASEVIGNDFWVGGSFELELQIKKKHRVTFLCTEGISTKGKWHMPRSIYATWHSGTKSYAVTSYKPLLNIYNED